MLVIDIEKNLVFAEGLSDFDRKKVSLKVLTAQFMPGIGSNNLKSMGSEYRFAGPVLVPIRVAGTKK
jgi:hypothetical protein